MSKGIWVTEESLIALRNDIQLMFDSKRVEDFTMVIGWLSATINDTKEAYNPKDQVNEMLDLLKKQEEKREENLIDSIACSIISGYCSANPVNHINMQNVWDMATKIAKAKKLTN